MLSVKDVVSTHLAILASTGSGKSYTAGVLVEELMNQYNRASVLIVDPHGEYHTMGSIMGDEQFFGKDGYRPEVKIFTPDKIKVRFSTLTEADVKYLLPEGTSDKMNHFLSQAFRKLTDGPNADRKLWGYHDLRDAVNEQKYGEENAQGSGGNVSSIDGLLWRLDSRFDRNDGIFHDHEHIELKDLFAPGRCTILAIIRHRTARTTSHRRNAPATSQQSENAHRPRRGFQRREFPKLSRFHAPRRSTPFRTRRSKRRFNQHPKTNPLRRSQIRRRHRLDHTTPRQTRPGRSLAMYDADNYANRQPD